MPGEQNTGSVARRGMSPSLRFLNAVAGFKSVVFLSHVNPDPDSLGSMLGLAHLVRNRLHLPTRLTRDGFIGRAENQALVRCLDIELEPIENVEWEAGQAVVMVDSQPHTGRHTLPDNLKITAVIDHHDTPGDCSGVTFADVRSTVGATCTLVTEYLLEQHVPLTPRVATALYYGIDSELAGYPREGGPLDDAAMQFLYPHVDKDKLAYIRNARLPHEYYETLLVALQNAFLYDRLILSWAGELSRPESVAEIADLLVRFEEIDWALCHGVYEQQILLSLRTARPRAQAGIVLQRIVDGLGKAGGHHRRAGGAIPLSNATVTAVEQTRSQIRRRVLEVLGIDEQRGQRLVRRKDLLESIG
ncbi:MAG: DHH family phosphoesterase [Gemmatales bacterium]|nr:DHH family phosphoesterase [Gemmatales bacterium]MDW8388272.1 DHH family phosphoesterase [Gemmatales bacterium]